MAVGRIRSAAYDEPASARSATRASALNNALSLLSVAVFAVVAVGACAGDLRLSLLRRSPTPTTSSSSPALLLFSPGYSLASLASSASVGCPSLLPGACADPVLFETAHPILFELVFSSILFELVFSSILFELVFSF